MRSSPQLSQRDGQRQATRRAILVAARTLFRSHGVDSVSMDDIARGGALGRATVYMYFPGKSTLLAALLQEDWDGQARLFERLSSTDTLDRQGISIWIKSVIEGMRKARDSLGIHRVALGQDPELAVLHQEHRKRLSTILVARLGAKSPRTHTALEVDVEATMLVVEIEFLAYVAVTAWGEDQVQAGVSLMTDRILAFMRKP